MWSLSPMINQHDFFDKLDVKIFSTNESTGVSIHEIVVQWINIDTKCLSWVSADALINNTEVVDDPHVLFDMSDVCSLVFQRHFNVKDHLESVVVPIVDKVTSLSLVAVIFGGVWPWESTDTSWVCLVSDHYFKMTMLSEL